MIEIFDLKEGKVVVNPDKLAIPVFKEIYERDKVKTKDTAFKELSFIYFLVDYRSPYSSYPINKKEEQIILDVIKDNKWKPDSLVRKGIEKYEEFLNTPIIRLVAASKETCDKLTEYFKGIDFTKEDDTGKPIYTAKDVIMNLSKVGDVADSLIKLEDRVKKEIKQESKVRGGGDVGLYEN